MKRLTYRDKSLPRKNDHGEIVEAYSDYDVREIINRLAAYEDNGTPEEFAEYKAMGLPAEKIKRIVKSAEEFCKSYIQVAAEIEFQHIKDLLNAEEQGRLVVLPCKVGDIVYAIVAYVFANTPTVIPTAVRSVTIHDDHISVTYDKRINTIGDCGVWGKTVFASREEAQAELERRYAN